jgi:hypothetical protein
MSGIQILLLTGILFLGSYFVIRLKKSLLDLVIILGMAIAAIALIIWPEITNRVAAYLNVGRGADLIFYVSILLFWYVILKLYIRIRNLEKLFTDVIRRDALNNIEKFSLEDKKAANV